MMKRREFITLLGGAAAAWPLAARAQQGERVRRIGVLLPAAPDDAEFQSWVGASLQGLAQSGWITGRNIRIETRWTKFDTEDTRKYAAELVALGPDVIVATGTSTLGPLLRLTRTVPIVFPLAADPVARQSSRRHPAGCPRQARDRRPSVPGSAGIRGGSRPGSRSVRPSRQVRASRGSSKRSYHDCFHSFASGSSFWTARRRLSAKAPGTAPVCSR